MEVWRLKTPAGAACTVLPELGSQLGVLRLVPARGERAVDVLDAPEPLGLRQAGYGAGAPILFPFPGRITTGRYTHRGLDYHIPGISGRHPLHGFVGRAPWQAIDGGADAHAAWVRTRIDSDGLHLTPDAFPGPFRLEVVHRLDHRGYRQEILAANTGDRPFPFGYGWHPYFRAPLGPGGSRADCLLRIAAAARWELNADLLPTGRRLEVAGPYDLREPNALADKSYDVPLTALAPEADGTTTAALIDPAAGLTVRVWAGPGFGHWVVYSPRTRPAVALEPYTCVPDAFNLEPRGIPSGLLELQPGETWQGELGVTLAGA